MRKIVPITFVFPNEFRGEFRLYSVSGLPSVAVKDGRKTFEFDKTGVLRCNEDDYDTATGLSQTEFRFKDGTPIEGPLPTTAELRKGFSIGNMGIVGQQRASNTPPTIMDYYLAGNVISNP